jgi:Cu/Ag efflux pump CusA
VNEWKSEIGRSERGDAEDVNNIETYVEVKPIDQWRKGFATRGWKLERL